MQLAEPGGELHAVDGIPEQRVPEGASPVLRIAPETLLHPSPESLLHLISVEHPCENRDFEVPAQDRGGLDRLAKGRVEPVEAGRDQGAQGVGHSQAGPGGLDSIRTVHEHALPFQDAAVLLDVERVAACLRMQQVHQRGRRAPPQLVLDHLSGGFLPEELDSQGQGRVPRQDHGRAGLVLGARGDEPCGAAPRKCPDEPGEQPSRVPVEPLGIIQHEDPPAREGESLQQCRHGAGDALESAPGVERLEHRARPVHPHDRSQRRPGSGQRIRESL